MSFRVEYLYTPFDVRVKSFDERLTFGKMHASLPTVYLQILTLFFDEGNHSI